MIRSSLATVIALVLVAPPVSAAAGDITGTLVGGTVSATAVAIDRASGQKFNGKVDERTGRFRIAGLPVGGHYDLLIQSGHSQLEGVSLNVPNSDYEEEQPLSAGDIARLKEITRSLNKFENHVDVLAVKGNIQHAAVVVNKLKTGGFVNSAPGEVIWRLELWHFERPDDHWIKVQDELFIVLHRERLQKSVYDKISLTLDARLGGLTPTMRQPEVKVGRIEMPAAKPGVYWRSGSTKR